MNNDLASQFNKIADSADEFELLVLKHVIEGLLQKKQKNESFVNRFFQFESKMDGDCIEMSMPITSLVQNSLDIVHGGLIATLIDSAMGTLVHTVLPEEKAAVTTELQTHYLKPAIGDKLICRSSLLHKGGKIMVLEGKVYREDGVMCAHSTASFFVIDR